MRAKPNTTSLRITHDVNTVNLPRSSIHNGYILEFHITLLNDSGSSITPTVKNILDGITEIALISDSTRVHYSLNGWDCALLNATIQKVQTNDLLSRTFASIADDETQEIVFCLYLDEGKILALAHNNLELRVQFAHNTKDGLVISNAECFVTIMESICSTPELKAQYGEDLVASKEPKVYALSVDVPASTEFVGVMDMPNGTLLRGAVVYITNEANIMPYETGILRTVPDRVELFKLSYPTHRALDEITHQTTFPEGVLNYDFGSQWQDNGIGKDGWSFAKGDIEIAVKTPAASKLRYISRESLVNTDLYAKSVKFTEY